jgi:hypothetical protein
MNVSKDEAAAALAVIARSGDYMQVLRRYACLGPFLLIWGLVWAGANSITDLMPVWSGRAWFVGSAIGLGASVLWGLHLGRRASRPVEGSTQGPRIRSLVMMGLTLCCYFPAMYAVLGPLSARQANAFASLSWAVAYMIVGSVVGWRMFAIGCIAGAAVVFGYLCIGQHYYLWMAACGGGTLIAGGLWLRQV